MKKTIALLMVLLMGVPAMAMAVDYGKQKAVYHINGGDERQNSIALRNIQNHINAVGAENMQINVVMHGGGVDLMMRAKENENLKASIDNLKMQNVKFQVCNNTLVGRKIDHKTQMYNVDDSDIVPSGVAHLSHLQGQGFTYVKP
ncbi:MAG: DsrE family protein [Chromatiales bacterium]|nr:DsrE family protein [Gammaproteobacteria bacterium]MBW6477172.1 DsrE family protein [Chromatiales bacterium]